MDNVLDSMRLDLLKRLRVFLTLAIFLNVVLIYLRLGTAAIWFVTIWEVALMAFVHGAINKNGTVCDGVEKK